LITALVGISARRTAAQTTNEVTVSAAISLKDSLDEIGKLYEKAHPGAKISFNYAGSGTLQRQIEQGAPVDIFFSAAEKQMDDLQT
jgi:molybdate transport system substrate-binding protein